MARIILFLLAMVLGFALGIAVSKAVKYEKEPLIGDLCVANDGNSNVLYLNVNSDCFMDDIADKKTVRLTVDDSIKRFAD